MIVHVFQISYALLLRIVSVSTVVKSINSKSRGLGLKSQLCYLLGKWCWSSNFTSVYLGSLTYKMHS